MGEETLLAATWDRVTEAVDPLDEADFDRPTRAALWDVRALLLHLLLDAQRTLVALASPAGPPTDVDAVSYWRPFLPSTGDGGRAHGEWVARSAACYDAGADVRESWCTTSAAAVRAVAAADPAALVTTQGHVLTVADLVSTLVVEATVHLLDLTLEVPGGPPDAALAHTRTVLEGLLGEPLPADWDDRTAVLRATARTPYDDPRFPVLG